MSNFLGDMYVPARPTSLLSANELMEREVILLQKSMNFRDREERLSVFLILPKDDGEYQDAWDAESQVYSFLGHDSTTKETGKSLDQLLTYASGVLTDNGKFYKAAQDHKDGVRPEALQIQVYEKIDPGVWFDKGIFDLVDAAPKNDSRRTFFSFHLMPADRGRTDRDTELMDERFLSAAEKAAVWKKAGGRCAVCGIESGLRFRNHEGTLSLVCAKDRGENSGWGLLG